MKNLIVIPLYLGLLSPVSAASPAVSEHIIHGEITDREGEKLSGIRIQISNPCDAGKTTEVLSENGIFRISVSSCDSFRMLCLSKDYDSLTQIIRPGEDSVIQVRVSLQARAAVLDLAEVSKISNAVSVKGDKTIVDAAKISPGGIATALDLLIRCPGVVVDEQNNTLRLKGRNGVMIMTDDRLLQLSGEDLFTWLRNTPAQSIDRIELISNPSARYDAAGNAGIINLKMKKNIKPGTYGNINSSIGQGRYGKLNEGFSLQSRQGKNAYQLQYNFAIRRAFNQLHLQRDFYSDDSLMGSYRQRNYLRFPFKTHNFRAGIDREISKKISTGISAGGIINRFDPNGKNYSDVLGNQGQVISYFSTINDSHEKRLNGSINAYLRILTDTLGSFLSADADFARFANLTDQLFTTEYFDNGYAKNKPDYRLKGALDGDLMIIAFKSDFVKKFRNGRQFESGLKMSRVTADNDVLFTDVSDVVPRLDSGKSNHFIYTETIAAAYAQTAGNYRGWEYQAGLRAEQTLAHGIQKFGGEQFNRNYFQLFPSASLQKKLKSGNITGLSLSRRIQRPAYGQLNPFKFYLDPTTYRAGNPLLQPELTWNAEVQFILAGGCSFTAGLNHTDRIITEIIYPSETEPGVTVQTNQNLSRFRNLVFTVSGPVKAGKKSSGFWTLNAALQNFRGYIASTALDRMGLVYDFNGMQNFVLNSFWTAELTGSFQSAQPYAYMSLRPLGQLGLGLQRSLLKKQGYLKLSVTDVFFTGNPRGDTDFEGYHEYFEVQRETRVAMLSFSYRFGNPQGPARRRQGGAEEEKQRAQGGLG